MAICKSGSYSPECINVGNTQSAPNFMEQAQQVAGSAERFGLALATSLEAIAQPIARAAHTVARFAEDAGAIAEAHFGDNLALDFFLEDSCKSPQEIKETCLRAALDIAAQSNQLAESAMIYIGRKSDTFRLHLSRGTGFFMLNNDTAEYCAAATRHPVAHAAMCNVRSQLPTATDKMIQRFNRYTIPHSDSTPPTMSPLDILLRMYPNTQLH